MRFIAAVLLVAACYASAQNTPVILCGRQLANARVLLCYGSEFVDKRGGSPTFNMLDTDLGMSRIWGGRHGALSASWSRYKREGLADECCLKPCTTDVILSYC